MIKYFDGLYKVPKFQYRRRAQKYKMKTEGDCYGAAQHQFAIVLKLK
jgi:hypothetical protein